VSREDVEDISYQVDGTGPDGQFQWGTDDLEKDLKRTLADFLHCVTSESPTNNKYEVPSGYEEGTYREPDGSPAAIQTGGPYRDNAFSTDPSLESFSNPFLDALSDTLRVADYLDKGEDGHDLLRGIDGNDLNRTGRSIATDGSTDVQKQVSQVLRSNRWNPTEGNTPYVTGDQQPDPPKLVPNESSLGAFRDPVTGELLATAVSVETMRKVALSLMLKATGDDPNGTQDPDSANPLAPTFVQIGSSRIEPTELEARRAYEVNELSRVTLDSDFPRKSDDDYKSYGNLNSFLEPFDGFLPLGMIALAATTTVTLIVSAQVIFSILALITSNEGKSVRIDPGPYIPGQYGKPEPSGLLGALVSPRTLGLVHTENQFSDAALRGANVFFGFSGDNLADASSTALLNILQAPGYYAVTTRTIFRSLNTISNALKDVDFSNPVGGAQAALGMVDVIRSSKVVSFFNVIAGLGDIALRLEQQGYTVEPGSKQLISMVDDLPDNPATHVMKSRAKDGPSGMSLAWRTSSTAAAYLLPASLLTAAGDFGAGQKTVAGLLGTSLAAESWVDGAGKSRSSLMADRDLLGSNRIHPEVVQEIEDVLDGEYVPFYFHDLRTNEIVSFHAFLSSLSDDFSVNYESTEAYGRIDAVKTYKNTERSISLSFHVAATSREDFDVMWWKINKMITLLYPQWTQGRLMQNSVGSSFIQPFSQILSASPLIRMRVGDVIKTNYSKFNLGRLFGLGTESFKPDPGQESSNFGDGIGVSVIDEATRTVTTMMRDPDLNGSDYGYVVGDRVFLKPSNNGNYLEADPVGNVLQKAASIITGGSARKRLRTKQEYEVEITGRQEKTIDRNKTPLMTGQKTLYQVKFVGSVVPPGFEDSEVKCTHTDIRIDPDWVVTKMGINESLANHEEVNSITSDFLSSESNPIVRSFESAKGRGLAGVITSMNFDWYEPTWETDPGARAPQWCKIEMNFSPIHDIPPGLDADGFNRAPVYPVGLVGEMVGDVHGSDPAALKDKIRELISHVDAFLSENGA